MAVRYINERTSAGMDFLVDSLLAPPPRKSDSDKAGAIPGDAPTARVRATALAVLSKESDAWTPTEWSQAAIDLASAIVAVAGDIGKIEALERGSPSGKERGE